jgi:hypothetical protein
MGWTPLCALVFISLLFSLVAPWACPACGTENILPACEMCNQARPSIVPVVVGAAGLVASVFLQPAAMDISVPVVFQDKYSRVDTEIAADVAREQMSDSDLLQEMKGGLAFGVVVLIVSFRRTRVPTQRS